MNEAIKALCALEALAKVATPGPWFNRGELSAEIVDRDRKPIAEAVCIKTGPDGDLQDEANGLFIAAANPQVILAAIEALKPIAEGTHVVVPMEPDQAAIYAINEWTDNNERDGEVGYSDAQSAELYRVIISAGFGR